MDKNHNKELIGISEVAEIFDASIETINKYIGLKLIEPCKKIGKKHLYDADYIFRRKKIIDYYKDKKIKLSQIPELINTYRDTQYIEDIESATNKILVIDDDIGVNTLIESFAKRFYSEIELNVYYETIGRKGIETAKRIKPDVIIIDLGLPDITGVEVYEELKNHNFANRPKFIIISGSIELKQLFEVKDVVLLQKPLSIDGLFKEIKALIDVQN